MSSQSPTTERTQVLHGFENTTNAVRRFISNTRGRISGCSDSTGPSVTVGVELYKKAMIDLKNRGVKVKHITEVTKGNLRYCKALMKMLDELRHLDGIKGNFALNETEYLAAAAALQEAKPVRDLLYSNVKTIVEQQQYVFDTLWNKAVPAEQKIEEIEKGIELEYFEVFTDRDRERVNQILLDLAESVKREFFILLPSAKALIRVDRLGVIDNIITASRRGATVKIICPISEENSDIIKKIAEQASAVRILGGNNTSYGMYIVDGEKFLKADVKEPKAETFSEAIGFAVHSNSKVSVESFRSVFELLWNEHTLNEELKRAYKMQNEFINIASHEMKTPTQAILGYSKLIEQHPEKSKEMMQAISRNATRLQRLTSDILDVSRIESRTLRLNLEQFDLNQVISDVVEDYRNEIEKSNSGIKLFHEGQNMRIQVEADKNRLAQVISNLLNNAMKFTKEGSITINAEKSDGKAVVSVKDTGQGIDPVMFPKLFSKFAAKSETGTGLGLFISKSIVEAHGGKIWAKNNAHYDRKKGATFYFTLPIDKKQQQHIE
jgi:two-component system sensor histidine kinase VicK